MTESIALVTISLDNMAGGLERNIVRLANRLAKAGKKVCLISFDWETAEAFYDIDDRVAWHKVATSPPHSPISFSNRFRLIGAMRRALAQEQATTVVCFHHGILARVMLASVFLGLRLVVSERSALTIYDHIKLSKWNLNFLLMSLADRVTVQFPAYIDDYPAWLRRRIVVVPNPVLPAAAAALPDEPNAAGRFVLLSVGRLCAQKNYALLVEAFASLADQFGDWDLEIAGDGDLYDSLLEDIARAGLSARIRLIPPKKDVYDLYRSAHLFCLPSQWEGFPNALAEAMSFGLPSVGYDGCAGVRDLIEEGETGRLAEGMGNVASLAAALRSLMSDPEARKRMGTAAAKSVERYDEASVFAAWDRALSKPERAASSGEAAVSQ